MAVGFWNFVGAGMFGFLINFPSSATMMKARN